MFREGAGHAVLPGWPEPVPVRPGCVVVAMPRQALGMRPDGTVTLSRVFLSPDYLMDQVRYQHPLEAFDSASARMVWDRQFAHPCQVVRLPAHRLGEVHGWLDGLSRATGDHSILANHFQTQQWTMGILGEVMPLLKPRPGEERGAQAALPGLDEVRFLAPCVSRALTWIERRYRDPWPLAELAEAVGMSPRGLTKAFSKCLGQSPLEVRDELRVRELGRLLAQTDTTVLEAALSVGWASDDQAVARFKRARGVTPMVWRDRFRQTAIGGGTVDLAL